ncbi:MAG TPA: D-2-hydroxyacid dehydrogenase [Acidimicrobiales bacterium]|nr:D-2-hydroxyacid dehydrogenase [Acidimicrobiales bacterium]
MVYPDHPDGDRRPVGPDDFDLAWGFRGALRRTDPGSFADLLDRSTSLRWLQSFSAGNDQPVIRRLIDRGVLVTASRAGAVAIAEFVLRSVLGHYQQPDRWQLARESEQWAPGDFREVWGTRWLIVGLGAIGTATAVRARAFGAEVVGVRRRPAGDEPVDAMIDPGGIAGALPAADVVVLAVPGTPETHHLVDERFLGAMQPGSVLVNVARGTLIDDRALLAALDRGCPEVAILDAVTTEPPGPGHPYWRHERVVLSPHTSSRGTQVERRQGELFLENLARYVDGRPLRDRLD